MDFLYVLGIILGLGVIAFTIFYFKSQVQEQEEPDTSATLINHMKKHSGGHAFLKISQMNIGEKRVKVLAYPRDFNRKSLVEISKGKKIKPYELFFDKRLFVPKSDMSDHTPTFEGYPDKIEHLSESDKNDQSIVNFINKKITERSIDKLYDARIKNLEDTGLKFATGKLQSEKEKQWINSFSDNLKLREPRLEEKWIK